MKPEVIESHGKRNLIILGAGALCFTVLSTGLSLWIYRSTGDIYLDRSRPGYLPDREEAKEESGVNSSFSYSDTGALDKSELDTYLKELKTTTNRLKALSDPYSMTPLSNESLGIPAADAEGSNPEKIIH